MNPTDHDAEIVRAKLALADNIISLRENLDKDGYPGTVAAIDHILAAREPKPLDAADAYDIYSGACESLDGTAAMRPVLNTARDRWERVIDKALADAGYQLHRNEALTHPESARAIVRRVMGQKP